MNLKISKLVIKFLPGSQLTELMSCSETFLPRSSWKRSRNEALRSLSSKTFFFINTTVPLIFLSSSFGWWSTVMFWDGLAVDETTVNGWDFATSVMHKKPAGSSSIGPVVWSNPGLPLTDVARSGLVVFAAAATTEFKGLRCLRWTRSIFACFKIWKSSIRKRAWRFHL